MTLKVKLFRKTDGSELDDSVKMFILQEKIEQMLKHDYSDFDYSVKVYGELIPIHRNF